jgi:hypothetical protein
MQKDPILTKADIKAYTKTKQEGADAKGGTTTGRK